MKWIYSNEQVCRKVTALSDLVRMYRYFWDIIIYDAGSLRENSIFCIDKCLDVY